MAEYETRRTRVTIAPVGEPVFSELAIHVEIVDEAGGEYLAISQDGRKVCLDQDEWPAVRQAIDEMFSECLADNKESERC